MVIKQSHQVEAAKKRMGSSKNNTVSAVSLHEDNEVPMQAHINDLTKPMHVNPFIRTKKNFNVIWTKDENENWDSDR